MKKRKRSIFLEHILLHNGPVKIIIKGQTEGQNCRGRLIVQLIMRYVNRINCELKMKAERQ